jgi:hypothetical protein
MRAFSKLLEDCTKILTAKKRYDKIYTINGRPVNSLTHLKEVLGYKEPEKEPRVSKIAGSINR